MRVFIVMVLLSSSLNAFGAEEKKKVKSVFVQKAAPQEIFDTFTYPAKVIPEVNALVLSESQGVVKKLNAKLGEKVRAGQVLASVQHTDPVYKYRPVNLRAPVAGVISKIMVGEGSTVAKGERVLMITDPLKAKIILEISTRDLAFVKSGLEGTLNIRGVKKALKAKITGISPFIDPATGTATAELRVAQEDKALVPLGSLGKVSFKSNQHQGFVIPESALVYVGNDTFLRVVDEKNTVNKIKVLTGTKRRGQVEILEGVKAGQLIVNRASGFLGDGAEVEIKNLPKKEDAKKKVEEKGDSV